MYNLRHQDGKKSPGNRGGEADVSVYLEFLAAVIPVTDFEKLLHHIACHVFKGSSRDYARDIHKKQIIFDRQGNPQHHHGPGAIKRQHGETQKPPVYKMFLFQ